MWKVKFILICALLNAITAAAVNKPNIILILTDDQDVTLQGMTPMKETQQLIGAAGATFTNAVD